VRRGGDIAATFNTTNPSSPRPQAFGVALGEIPESDWRLTVHHDPIGAV